MLPHFSSNVILPPEQKKTYNVLRFSLVLFFLLFSCWFVYTLLFPVRHFVFDASVDSLANTISRPTLTATGTSFDVAHPFTVDRLNVEIVLSESAPLLPEKTRLDVTKSYSAFLSPLVSAPLERTASENTEDLAVQSIHKDGSLIASPSGVFVITEGLRRAFDTEQTLLASGYDFSSISETTSEERSQFRKGKILSMQSAHPVGTHFRTTDTQESYLVHTNGLSKVPTASAPPIDVQFASRTTKSSCVLTQHTFHQRKYSCTVDLSTIKNFDGKRYTITLPNMPLIDIADITLSFDTELTPTSFAERLTELNSLFVKNSNRSR